MRLTAVAVLLSATSLFAEPFTCGTSIENSRDVRAAGELAGPAAVRTAEAIHSALTGSCGAAGS